jgi:hypothetical protein
MADEMVKLILAWSSYGHQWPSHGHEEGPGVYTRSVLVKVRSLWEKSLLKKKSTVTICQYGGNAREEATFEASYLYPTKYGEWELWRWDASGPELRGGQFKIRYRWGEEEYWDDNRGEGYALGDADGALLGRDVNVRMLNAPLKNEFAPVRTWARATGTVRSGEPTPFLEADIAVRNIAYAKRVRVVYTRDNWMTQGMADAEYCTGYSTGSHENEILRSPNQHGVEMWRLHTDRWPFDCIPFYENGLEFAISYEVAGETYWDNNFGDNYFLARPPNLRCEVSPNRY